MPHQLSIIVTIRSDHEDFESTLVSILENRPARCEVIVAHDGSYSDPFDLGDEVVFAVAESDNLVDLIDAGAQKSDGEIIHIVADGVEVTQGWAEEAIANFRDTTGCVSPVILHAEDDSILGAGWTNDAQYLRRGIACGATAVGRLESERIFGPFLVASFWRRDALLAALEIDHVETSTDAEVVWAQFLHSIDLDISIAANSFVLTSPANTEVNLFGFHAGYEGQIASHAVQPNRIPSTMASVLSTCISAPHRIRTWTTAFGRVAGCLRGSSKSQQLAGSLEDCASEFLTERSTIAMPAVMHSMQSVRNAA